MRQSSDYAAIDRGITLFGPDALKTASIISLVFCCISGCSTPSNRPIDRNHLVEALYSKGARPSTTEKLVLRGSEGGFGSDVNVVITDPGVISRVWTCILNSKNYGVFSACGYRKIEFYSAGDSDTPLATLILHCGTGDAAYLEGQDSFVWDTTKGGRDGLYQCRGLNELVEPYLCEEYHRRQSSSTNGEASLIRITCLPRFIYDSTKKTDLSGLTEDELIPFRQWLVLDDGSRAYKLKWPTQGLSFASLMTSNVYTFVLSKQGSQYIIQKPIEIIE